MHDILDMEKTCDPSRCRWHLGIQPIASSDTTSSSAGHNGLESELVCQTFVKGDKWWTEDVEVKVDEIHHSQLGQYGPSHRLNWSSPPCQTSTVQDDRVVMKSAGDLTDWNRASPLRVHHFAEQR